ncbi:uncharacterized protein LOC124942205 [Impatiens glandulifera]|uniref:uncharacterized protein LOC124942205 n=1 Tax=Impatiens glandulifera TaxID=253017 RepID=UPI001FB05773|nr:uncharacterized protein LOC124942205 [Impatiens glandulifera]
MSDPSKIRLVRCPKCENLLPELADYSVYQCGGCGAVLRAKKKNVEEDDDKICGDSEILIPCGEEGEVSNGCVKSEPISAIKAEKTDILVAETDKNQIRSEKTEVGNKIDDSKPRKPRFVRYSEEEEGPSNYQMRMKSVENGKVEFFEEDQAAQFLRKLDELKEQLNRSREMNQNTSNVSFGRRFGFPEDSFIRRNSFPDPAPYPNRHERFRNGSLRSMVHETDPYHHPHHHPYFNGHYQEPFETTYPYRNPNHNNLSCSCCVQYPNHFPNNPFPENPNRFSGRDYRTRVGNRCRPPTKMVVPPISASKARCLPLSGGAPFVTCHNCLELLRVPKRVLFVSDEENQTKMKCGACSTNLLLRVVNKKLYVSVYEEASANCRVGLNFSSEDYDNSGYDFHSMGHEGFVAEMTSVPSGSPYSSEDDISPDSIKVDRLKESNSSELEPPSAGSPLKDHFDFSNKYNQSGRSDCEVGFQTNAGSRQNSMKDASVATEIDASFQEYLNLNNTETSQEEDHQQKNHKPKLTSNFAGIIKKSLKELSRSIQPSDQGSVINVAVNGHPIPDRLLKKAEKLAGSIQPGNYWYDFRAGFWGLMGGPCLGIIPPYIDEFNKPMPENCSGGNTGVFVNGRELHQKDHELLCMRGLPTARGRSYIIEISGRVLDEESGEELDSLGKLAPTVERSKHGFGMKPPKVRV